MNITKAMAREFYRDLCGTVNGDANKTNQGIMSEEMIAERMNMPIEQVNAFLDACRKYTITERQGGAWVV